ncbi:MAG: effector-associated domain EAD1-containing protein [Caldilineaceae bacterium]
MTSPIPSTDPSEAFASEDRGQLRHVPLNGAHVGALHEALLDAFTVPELKHLLVFELSMDLDQIAPEERGDARETVYAVVRWAIRQKEIGVLGLLAAAFKTNPGNPSLMELHCEWQDVVFDPPSCPYPGLNQYKREDSDRFFGREDETLQALDKLRRHPVLAVIGPSGSGKSSLLAASIIPELLRSSFFPDTTWTVKEMRPGGQPMSTLTALLPLPRAGEGDQSQAADAPNQRLLLVVDQYEELFTLSEEKERAAFEQELLKYVILHAIVRIGLTTKAHRGFAAKVHRVVRWARGGAGWVQSGRFAAKLHQVTA